jgi:hypothetical protein
MQSTTLSFTLVTFALVVGTSAASAQTFQVRVVQREEIKRDLTAVVPQAPDSNTSDKNSADKTAKNNTASNTSGTHANTTDSNGKDAKKPETRTQTVTGAKLTLQLPDRRTVHVACESKYALRFDYINRRDCRVPPVDELTATFDGDQAKLIWPISLDGKKTQSETYTILSIGGSAAHR